MANVELAVSSLPQTEVVTTNQPMRYGLPGESSGLQPGQHPGYQQMQPVKQVSNITNIVVNQQQRRAGPRDWKTGLFGCLQDAKSSYLTCYCTPCYSCYLATKLGESCCLPMTFCPGQCCPICVTPWLVALRVKLREANKIQYVGETEKLHKRINLHGSDCMTKKPYRSQVAEYFFLGHTLSDTALFAIAHNPNWNSKTRKENKTYWIHHLRTLKPSGLNQED